MIDMKSLKVFFTVSLAALAAFGCSKSESRGRADELSILPESRLRALADSGDVLAKAVYAGRLIEMGKSEEGRKLLEEAFAMQSAYAGLLLGTLSGDNEKALEYFNAVLNFGGDFKPTAQGAIAAKKLDEAVGNGGGHIELKDADALREAVQMLGAAAAEGDQASAFRLSKICAAENFKNGEPNPYYSPEKSFELTKKLISLSSQKSYYEFRTGVNCFRGFGTSRNASEAFGYFQKAAAFLEKADVSTLNVMADENLSSELFIAMQASACMAYCHEKGLGAPKDPAKAAQIRERICAVQNVAFLENLTELFASDFGGQAMFAEDPEAARPYYERAFALKRDMAEILSREDGKIAKRNSELSKMEIPELEKESSDDAKIELARRRMGEACTGMGLNNMSFSVYAYDLEKFPEALKTLEGLAAKGNARAALELAKMYMKGNLENGMNLRVGSPLDCDAEKAKKYLYMALKNDSRFYAREAYERLAEIEMGAAGRSIFEDRNALANPRSPEALARAVEYRMRAADMGNTACMEALSKMYEGVMTPGGRPVAEPDMRKAFYWKKRQALSGSADACLEIAKAYLEGDFLIRDIGKAADYLMLGAKSLSDESAKERGFLSGSVPCLEAYAVLCERGLVPGKGAADAAEMRKRIDALEKNKSWADYELSSLYKAGFFKDRDRHAFYSARHAADSRKRSLNKEADKERQEWLRKEAETALRCARQMEESSDPKVWFSNGMIVSNRGWQLQEAKDPRYEELGEKGKEFIRKAAKSGYVPAVRFCLISWDSVDEGERERLKEEARKSENEDLRLSAISDYGGPNSAEDLEKFDAAAAEGNVLALRNLTSQAFLSRQYLKSARLFGKYADKSVDKSALLSFSIMQLLGVECDQDAQAALRRLEWLSNYRELGILAGAALSYAYENGVGVPKDPRKAALYAKGKGSFQNIPSYRYDECISMLGNMYQSFGKLGDAPQLLESMFDACQARFSPGDSSWWYSRVLENLPFEKLEELAKTETAAKAVLGGAYFTGSDVGRDYSKAYELFNEAYNDGETSSNSIAPLGLFYCLSAGLGTSADTARAAEVLKKTMENDSSGILWELLQSDRDSYYGGNNKTSLPAPKISGEMRALIAKEARKYLEEGDSAMMNKDYFGRMLANFLIKTGGEENMKEAYKLALSFKVEGDMSATEFKKLYEALSHLDKDGALLAKMERGGNPYVAYASILKGLRKDDTKGAAFKKLSGMLDKPVGCMYAALCYEEGWGVSKDSAKADELLKKAVSMSMSYDEARVMRDALSMLWKARSPSESESSYLLEFGDRAFALRFARIALDNPPEDFTRILKDIFKESKDYASLIRMCEKQLAEDKDTSELMEYPVMYFTGREVPQDYAKALEIFSKLSDDVRAQLYMSHIYSHGLGTPKDPVRAKECFDRAVQLAAAAKAARSSNFFRLYSAGDSFYRGSVGPEPWPKDPELGAMALEAAARIDIPKDYADMLARFYAERGETGKLIALYAKAFENGHYDSAVDYGIALLKGTGTPKDEAKAFEVFKKAAEAQPDRFSRSSPLPFYSRCWLAYMYAHGIGVQKDEEKGKAALEEAQVRMSEMLAGYSRQNDYIPYPLSQTISELKGVFENKAKKFPPDAALAAQCLPELERLVALYSAQPFDGNLIALYKAAKMPEKIRELMENAPAPRSASGALPSGKTAAVNEAYEAAFKIFQKGADMLSKEKASAQDEARLRCWLAVMHRNGWGTPKDEAKADGIISSLIADAKKAMPQNLSPDAKRDDLSYHLARAAGIMTSDSAKADSWRTNGYAFYLPLQKELGIKILEACEKYGEPQSYKNLAECYMLGRDLPQNDALAAEYYEKCFDFYGIGAKGGNYEGELSAAVGLYRHSKTSPNPAKAYALAKRAYEKFPDSEEAMTNMAFILLYGVGCEKDEAKAFEIFLALSKRPKAFGERGFICMAALELCYREGIGTAKDAAKADEIAEDIASSKGWFNRGSYSNVPLYFALNFMEGKPWTRGAEAYGAAPYRQYYGFKPDEAKVRFWLDVADRQAPNVLEASRELWPLINFYNKNEKYGDPAKAGGYKALMEELKKKGR